MRDRPPGCRGFSWREVEVTHIGCLPHVRKAAVMYFVIFRLAAALAARRVAELRNLRRRWLAVNPPPHAPSQRKEGRRLLDRSNREFAGRGLPAVRPGLAGLPGNSRVYHAPSRFRSLRAWLVRHSAQPCACASLGAGRPRVILGNQRRGNQLAPRASTSTQGGPGRCGWMSTSSISCAMRRRCAASRTTSAAIRSVFRERHSLSDAAPYASLSIRAAVAAKKVAGVRRAADVLSGCKTAIGRWRRAAYDWRRGRQRHPRYCSTPRVRTHTL